MLIFLNKTVNVMAENMGKTMQFMVAALFALICLKAVGQGVATPVLETLSHVLSIPWAVCGVLLLVALYRALKMNATAPQE